MPLENFSPTKNERAAIAKAFYAIETCGGHSTRFESLARQEHRGYGNRNDRVPLIAARGLCVKWFLDGLDDPSILIRQLYWARPAAVFFTGYGAHIAHTYCKNLHSSIPPSHELNLSTIRAGKAAYDAAFNRAISSET